MCARRRLKGGRDYSQGSPKEWQHFLDQIDCFIKDRHIDNRFIARKHLNSAKFSLLGLDLVKCVRDVWAALQNDRSFFLHKGIGLHMPVDIEELVNLGYGQELEEKLNAY